ncbi:MAG: hypothetical protein JNN07_27530 [Verrucomicrobiales bacterium]|nr:hypothetical protein [Verrucomicrobiales bacterium]
MATNIKILNALTPGVMTLTTSSSTTVYTAASPKSALVSGVAIYNNSTTAVNVSLLRGTATIFKTKTILQPSTSELMSDVVELASGEALNAQASPTPSGGNAAVTVLLFGIERD